MSTLFISHSSQDNDLAKRLERRLAHEQHHSVFLDLDPEKGIVAGRSWERTLYRKLRACHAVIALCTDNYLGSHWCFAEIALARMEGKHVVALLSDPLDSQPKLPAILNDRQFIDLRYQEEEGYRRLWRALKELDLVGVDSDWNPKNPPYLGLSAYQEEHAPVFFGRENESRAGIELLERGAPGLIMVLGSSGSGKSSLVRAGMLPRLRPRQDHWLIVDPIRPGRDPFANLAESFVQTYRRYAPTRAAKIGDRERIRERLEGGANALIRAASASETEEGRGVSAAVPGDDRLQRLIEQLEALRRDPPPAMADRLRDFLDWSLDDLRRMWGERPGVADPSASSVHDATPLVALADELRRDAGRPEARVLLVVDQFEEMLGSKDSEGSAHRFLALLRASVEADHSPLLCLGTMRSDFLGLFQRNAVLRGIDFESLSLGPMPIDGMRRVIERPAMLGLVELEDGLADRLLQDTETADALPLLSFTLSVMWRTRRERGEEKFTVRAYEELGGVQGAVATEADAILAMARRQGKEDDLRRALLQMARLSENGTYARQPVSWDSDEIRRVEPILEKFVERRLLVVRGEGDARIVEVAHEALFRSWEPLRRWLENARADLLLRQQLRRDAAAWEESGRPSDALWRGGRLLQARELLGHGGPRRPGSEPDREPAFIEAGLRQRRRQRQALSGIAVAVVAFLTLFLGYALVQADRARTERTRALDLALVSMAGEQLGRDPTTAALILTEVQDPENTPFAARRLGDVLRLPLLYAALRHGTTVTRASFSPDGNQIVTITGDNSVHVWDVKTGAPLTEPLRHDSTVTMTAVSPNGKLVLTAAGGSVWLWDIESGEQHFAEPWRHGDPVNAAAFSPNGDLVLTTAGGSVWLWDVDSGRPRFGEPWRDCDRVSTTALSPEGERVATGCGDGSVWVREVATGAVRFAEPWRHTGVNRVLFSPNGKFVLTRSGDGVVQMWDVQTGEERPSLESDAEPGGRFAIVEDGSTLEVWSVPDGIELLPSVAGGTPVTGAWLNPNEDLLLTVSGHSCPSSARCLVREPRADNMLRAWNLGNRTPRFEKELRHESEIMSAAFSPDGRLLATLSGTRSSTRAGERLEAENIVRVWNLESEGERFSFPLRGGVAAFSPDGTLVVTASADTARLWDAATGEPRLREPLVMEQPVYYVAFSPDGELVLTASREVVQLWEVSTGRPRFEEPWRLAEQEGVELSRVAFSATGRQLVAEYGDNTVQVWDVRAREKSFPEPPRSCGTIWQRAVRPAVSPDGTLLVSACEQSVQLWDIGKGTERSFPAPWRHDGGHVRSVAFSSDGRLVVTASDDGTARIWEEKTGGRLHELKPDSSSISWHGMHTALFSPDGKLVFAAPGGHIAWLWDVETGDTLHRLEHPGAVREAMFTADGRFVVTRYDAAEPGGNSGWRVWETGSDAPRSDIRNEEEYSDWSLGSSGKYLVARSAGSAQVWYLETGEPLFSPALRHPMSEDYLLAASISPDGKRLVTSSSDETRVWMISGELLQSALRPATVVCLSSNFRQQFLGEPGNEARTKHEACERSHGRLLKPAQAPEPSR